MSQRSENHDKYNQSSFNGSALDDDDPHLLRPKSAPNEATFFEDAKEVNVHGGRYISAAGSVNPSGNQAIRQGQRPHYSRTKTSFFNKASGVTVTGGDFISAGQDVHLPSLPQPNGNGAVPVQPSGHRARARVGPLAPDASKTTSSLAVFSAEHDSAASTRDPILTGEVNSSMSVASPSAERNSANSATQPVERSAMDNIPHPVPAALVSNTVGVTFDSLHDDADKDLISICREGKKGILYKLIQTEVQYDIDEAAAPYGILAFRLETGNDKKHCLKVELTGKFVIAGGYKNVNVKDIRCIPERVEGLAQVPVQHTVSNSVQVASGISAGKPSVLATFTRLKSDTITVLHSQTSHCEFNDAEGTFNIDLGVDKPVRKELSVVNPAHFVVLLKLSETRQPMKLELKLAVTYRRRSGRESKPLSKTIEHDYPGTEFYDIVKGKRSATTTIGTSG